MRNNDTDKKQRRQLVVFAVLGTILIAVVLLFTTIWVMNGARAGSDQAVKRVREFYLEELAWRRTQVVSGELEDNFSRMESALSILEEPYLESQEMLQYYLGKVEDLYRMDQFALADENGIVYTKSGIVSDADEYGFLSEEITEPFMSTQNLGEARKQVILAVPVEGVFFQGIRLDVCFIRLNIDEMISSASMQTNDTETYCNIYYQNGESLTNSTFGGFIREDNILSALAKADLEDGVSYEQVKRDFDEGVPGKCSFTYQGVKEDLCYIPVDNTGWMMTVLVRDYVISEQVGSISSGMIRRSIIQIIITVVVMLSEFVAVICWTRRSARIRLKKEKAAADKLREALDQVKRERAAMENIQAAIGAGLWSMEFNEKAEMISCTWTDNFRQILGYESEADFPNRLESWSDLLHKEDREWVLKEYWDTVTDYSGVKSYNVQYRMRTRNAGWRWFHAAGRLSRRKDGSPITFVGLFVDVDDERTMREQLEKQRLDLQDALAAAQHANKSKTTFLNNMSHDIRTPMNAIIGFTALAAAHLDNPEQVREYLTKITTSSNHLLSLINDVLDMSRIESGKVTIEEQETSLPEILHDLKTIVQADITSKQLEFYIDIADVVNENILCDRLRLNQVLLNLLSNAMKFTKPGGLVSVRVRQKENVSEGFASYEFRIRDTGIGMSEEFQKHVFDPFEREQTSTVSGIQGTGLGMAITKNIVDMMGGTISVASKAGEGTTFTVALQFRTCSGPVGHEIIPELHGFRALVADDDFHTCSSVTKMLSSIGMRPDWTTSGKEAILRVKLAEEQEDAYAVYIIDWLMPDMNGIEVVRRIRQLIGEETPIIILTAYDWTDMEAEAREAGVTVFCSKPIFLSELRRVLMEPFKTVKEEAGREEAAAFVGKKILLVEDNELNQEIAVEILGAEGFDVDVADDGSVAVEKMKAAEPGRYDLILMDIQMPIMNGYEATRQIRELPASWTSEIPIIAMTANAFDEDKKAAFEAGMNGHIAKPIDIPMLLELLNEILRQ